MICHGQGDPEEGFDGGCCFVDERVCPLRWYISYSGGDNTTPVETARLLDHNGTDLGSVDQVARSFVGNSPPKRQRIFDQLQGAVYVCSAAALGVDDNPNGLTDRAAFEAAWQARIEASDIPWRSGTSVAQWWADNNRPRNWCASFGPTEGQCCHGEDLATNTTRRTRLTVTAVAVRAAAPGAS